jgi:hypothetical protein
MFLKIVKEISAEDAKRLKEAKVKEQALQSLADANFLCETLVGQEKNFQDKDGEIRVKSIGEFSQPEFGIVKDFFTGEAYRRILSRKAKETLFFSIGSSSSVPGVNFNLRNGADRRYKFASGTFFDRRYDKKHYIDEAIIFKIASYFHDKKELYSTILQFLLKNKEVYSGCTSKEFIEDLILLFSTDYAFKDIPVFNISFCVGKELFLKRKTIRKDWFYLGKEFFYPKNNVERFWCKPELQTDLWLKDNKLIFITSWIGESDCFEETFRKKIADPEFKQFLEENLQDWLQHIVATANFGMVILEQVKTKILFSTL